MDDIFGNFGTKPIGVSIGGNLTCEEVDICEFKTPTKLGKLEYLMKILNDEIEIRNREINFITNLINNAQSSLEIEQIQEIDNYLESNYNDTIRKGFRKRNNTNKEEVERIFGSTKTEIKE